MLKSIDKYINKIHCGDCLDLMEAWPDNCVDLCLCDPPYGTTACKWDTIIPLARMWKCLTRIAKSNAAMIFTASQPFTSVIVMSNPIMFRHEWIYKKRCASNFAQAKYAPMKEHESVLVFGKNKVNYYPLKEKRQGSGADRAKYAYSDKSRHASGDFVGNIKGEYDKENDAGNDTARYPSSVQEFNNRAKGDRGKHPTQKPVLLMEYFIKTYSLLNALILDFSCGSGSTCKAAQNLGRRFIGIDISEKYCEIARMRLKAVDTNVPVKEQLQGQKGLFEKSLDKPETDSVL